MRIDLNADLGEGCGEDAAMLEVVTSASVASGGHTGDRASMHLACDTARRGRVRIGAHPSYEDRVNFGRVSMDIASDELGRLVLRQLRGLAAEAVRVGSRISYLKPHGALYHDVAANIGVAESVVKAVANFAPGLPVLGLPGSHFLRLASESGLRPMAEGFADRAYAADGSLIPRSVSGSVLTDTQRVVRQAVLMATKKQVRAMDGSIIPVEVHSICLHGDTPGAVDLARAVRTALEEAGVRVAAFA
ncbi:MAG: LamB/YcsF family protein [Arachnia sp.]